MAIPTLPGQVFDFTVTNSSLTGMLQKINYFTDVGEGGSIGIIILLVVGVPLFLMMRSLGNERAFSPALLVTSLIGLFLRLLGLINDTIFEICIGLLIVSILFLIKEQGQFEN